MMPATYAYMMSSRRTAATEIYEEEYWKDILPRCVVSNHIKLK